MLREDLADARREWLESAIDNPKEYERRAQSDFLAVMNHEGEHLDFHALRHTCGAWLAMTGAHVKAVQSIMRHSSITLTMDTYGHLFPGQEADTVANLPNMLGNGPQELRATGTDDIAANAIKGCRPKPRQLGRKTVPSGAVPCDVTMISDTNKTRHKTLRKKGKSDNVRSDANQNDNAPGRTRTCDLRFRKPVLYPTELRAQSRGDRLYAIRLLRKVLRDHHKFSAHGSKASGRDRSTHVINVKETIGKGKCRYTDIILREFSFTPFLALHNAVSNSSWHMPIAVANGQCDCGFVQAKALAFRNSHTESGMNSCKNYFSATGLGYCNISNCGRECLT